MGEPSSTAGYNRVVKSIPSALAHHPVFHGPGGSTATIEIDFVGHALSDFVGVVPSLSDRICDDPSSQRVLISNGISSPVPINPSSSSASTPTKKETVIGTPSSTGIRKYIIAEIAHSVNEASAEKKIKQLGTPIMVFEDNNKPLVQLTLNEQEHGSL